MVTKKIIATIEARLASTRLPGKVLLPLGGKPVLQFLVERLKRSKFLNEIVIASSSNIENDAIESLAKEIGIYCFRGSEDDVLSRVIGAADYRKADIIVQLTGDCPLMDPELIDECVSKYLDGGYDYVANELVRTYPIGMDVAVFSLSLLKETYLEKDLTEMDKEHVTTYIVERPIRYKLLNVRADKERDRPDLQLTLDTKEDYSTLSSIVDSLYTKKNDFNLKDIIQFLDQHKEISAINSEIKRKKKDIRKLSVGLIGLGKIASDYDSDIDGIEINSHTKAFLKNEFAEIVAVADRDISKIQNFKMKWGFEPISFVDLDSFWTSEINLDLLSICSNTASHFEILKKAMEKNIPYILCEKPITDKEDELNEIVALSKRSNSKIIVNHILRWEPGVDSIKEKLRHERIQKVVVFYAKGFLHNGIHVVDLSLYLFGNPKKIIKRKEHIDGLGYLNFDFDLVYDSFEISFFALDEEKFSIFEYSIYTDLGKFVIDELTSKMKYFSIIKHPNIEGYRYIGSKAEEIECLQFQSMKNVIDDVVLGIRTGDESYFKSDLKATLSTMNILFDIMRTPCQN
ncbi:cytidylyltransferase domain-containing protein [Leptospira interrogans]|uniref:cytidylyltransferase domain-containing protein n=1 Tax=Leptospira interrogans TaxID=173 RepID=UPI0002BC63D8|nr:Gfo/Idh/MocA family oxidoreductase [Leptospira interrogans]EMN37699.1 cytidylyltransferase [Leptospira interrogans serovar Medanensis str. L0448]EMN39295.1 cytidylyltransferase [Leptospira interrogans str. L0996]EMN95745.1 cytidylyltransferase [Leptospira interrogans serovar Medanensis str. UT053]